MIAEYLHHIQTQLQLWKSDPTKPSKHIEVRIMNALYTLPTLQGHQETSHQIILTDPGEPCLTHAGNAHMIGTGSKDALPHTERVLLFFARDALIEPKNRVLTASPDASIENNGSLYIKADMYGDIAPEDTRFLKRLFALKAPTRADIETLFSQHYKIAHHFEDATQSFHQLLEHFNQAKAVKLAEKTISNDADVRASATLPMDAFFRQTNTLLGKALKSVLKKIDFTYIT